MDPLLLYIVVCDVIFQYSISVNGFILCCENLICDCIQKTIIPQISTYIEVT